MSKRLHIALFPVILICLPLSLRAQENRELSTHLSFGQEMEMIIELTIRDPNYWYPGVPSLYEVIISMKEAGQQDQEVVSSLFDFRSCLMSDSLFIQKGDGILLVYASEDLANALPGLPEQKISNIIEDLVINALRTDNPFPRSLEDLFLRLGILVSLLSPITFHLSPFTCLLTDIFALSTLRAKERAHRSGVCRKAK